MDIPGDTSIGHKNDILLLTDPGTGMFSVNAPSHPLLQYMLAIKPLDMKYGLVWDIYQ